MLYNNRQLILDGQKKALELAADELNWENESIKFLDIISKVTDQTKLQTLN